MVEVATPKVTPTNPMTEAEIIDKFKANASYSVLPSRRVDEIIQMVGELESIDDITKLTRLFTIVAE